MKILQFCKKIPIPPKDGESIAINQLSETILENNCELTVFSLKTPKHNQSNIEEQNARIHYVFKFVDTNISYYKMIQNIFFSKKSYIVERFYNQSVKNKLISLLETKQFDIVQLEGLFLGDYVETIKKYSKAKIVLRSHNVEHQIWERLAENYSGLKKWYLKKIMIPRLKNFEDNIATKVDAIVTISKLDEAYFKQKTEKPVYTLPAAYQIQEKIAPLPLKFSVGFIGGLDWLPNAEGIKWFLKNVWKTFAEDQDEVSFNLAGRNFPRRYYDLNDKKLFIYGEVKDAKAFTNENTVMIAPILSGSGMRIKIIEAMALGKTVISTRIGAEGINYTDKKNIFIANTPQEWINTLNFLFQNPEKLNETGKAAQALIKAEHDIQKLGANLIARYKKELV